MALRVLLVDDERLVRDGLRALLSQEAQVEIVGECANGREAVNALCRHRPDLVFLDVKMPGLSGFEVLSALPPSWSPYVIFLTAFDDYALQAFEVDAVDFILKPFTKQRFNAALERARRRIKQQDLAALNLNLEALLRRIEQQALKETARSASHDAAAPYRVRLPVQEQDRIRFIAVEEIEWIEAADNYVVIHRSHRTHLLRESIRDMAAQLDPVHFVRIHRSRIVNLRHVEVVQPRSRGTYRLTLYSGVALHTSRSGGKALKAALKLKP